MTKGDGELTDEHRAKFQEHISSKATLIGKCAVCGDRQWLLLDHFVSLQVYRPDGNVDIPGQRYPNVGMICGNCGHTQLVNAYVAGVLQGTPRKGGRNE